VYGGFIRVDYKTTVCSCPSNYNKPCLANETLFIPMFRAGLLNRGKKTNDANHPQGKSYIVFLFLHSQLCCRLLSDSPSRATPLSLTNVSYWQASLGFPPFRNRVCIAHKKKVPIFLSRT